MSPPVYRCIGASFKIDGKTYPGEAIASSQALYLILKGSARKWWIGIPAFILSYIVAYSIVNGADQLLLAIGASVGLLWLLAAIFVPQRQAQPPILNDAVARVTTIKDLPEEIRRHPDWPHERDDKSELRPVVIISRTDQLVIDHRKHSNLLHLHPDGIDIHVDHLTGQGAQIRDFLLANGWSLDWAGEKLTATAPPPSSETDAGILVSAP